jgi:hypothetical protein
MVPTPNAVGKNTHMQTAVAVPVIVQMITSSFFRNTFAPDSAPPLPAVEVIDLTCTRLC